jgi:DNA-binding MarR family transcriptional regulator
MSSQVLRDQVVPQAAVEAFVSLLRSHAGTSRELSADLLAEHGLTINDYECLLLLSGAEEQSLRRIDIASKLLLTASGVTRMLDGLEREGYVEKGSCASDARVTYAVLTDKGAAKLESAQCSHVAAICELFEKRFSPAELATLTELLSRLPGAAAPACDAAEAQSAAARTNA